MALPIVGVGVLKKSLSANGTTTLSVTPTQIGNCWVLTSIIASATIHISSISGGGATWQGPLCGPWAGTGTQQLEMWIGTITSTSTSTITITPTASTASILSSFNVQEFTAGGGTDIVWGVDGNTQLFQGHQTNTANTVVQFPTLNPGGVNRLYYGYAQTAGTANTTVQLSAFNYIDQLSTAGQITLYSVNCPILQAPGGTQTTSATSATGGMLITATGPTTAITALGPQTLASATGQTTLSSILYSGVPYGLNIGDMLMVTTHVNSATVHIATATAPGITFSHVGSGVSGAHSVDIWLGVVTNVQAVYNASGTVTFTGSAAITATVNTYTGQAFTAGGLGTTWAVDGSLATSNNTVSSTTIAYPSLTPASSGELYFGYGISGSALTTGGTLDYRVTADGVANAVIYDLGVSGTQAPTSTQTSSAASFGIGCLISATPPAGGSIQQLGTPPLPPFNTTATTTAVNSPATVGNLLVVFGDVHSSTIHFTTLSGGGVTTWTSIVGPFVGTSGVVSSNMWMGVVTTAGAATIVASASGSLSGLATELSVQEFTLHNPAAIWAVDTTGTLSNAASTTVSFPSLTPANSGEIYVGYVRATGSLATTVPTNYMGCFNYFGSTATSQIIYTSQLGAGAQAPTMTQGTSATSWTIGALISGKVPGGNSRIRMVSYGAIQRASTY